MYPKTRKRVQVGSDVYPRMRKRVHVGSDVYPRMRKWVHVGLDMHPRTAFGVRIVQLIRLTVSIVPYCQAVKKFVKPQSVRSLRIGLNALGGVCLIFSHSLLYLGVSLSCFYVIALCLCTEKACYKTNDIRYY